MEQLVSPLLNTSPWVH